MNNAQEPARYQKLISLRVTHQEKARLEEQASIAGLSVSEYMRRKFFGGRPIVAKSDETMAREFRRVGGLGPVHTKALLPVGRVKKFFYFGRVPLEYTPSIKKFLPCRQPKLLFV